jgi:hypothetical protein
VERLLSYKLPIILFLFLIFDYKEEKIFDEREVSLFSQKDTENLKHRKIYSMLSDYIKSHLSFMSN